jgi:cytochrome P450
MLLSLHPQVLKTLREEHDTVFDPNPDITLDILRQFPHKTNDLDYTTAVIKETLRMFPVGFGIRQANERSVEHDARSG